MRCTWTAADDRMLRRIYPSMSAAECAAQLRRSEKSVYFRAHALGLKKPKAWVAERARQRWKEGRHEGSRRGHFPKGHVPMNKGKKCPPGRGGNSPNARRTQFKPGQLSGAAARRLKPVGAERITREGILERKVHNRGKKPAEVMRRWVPVHRLVWEQANGPIPRGHVVRFRDGMHTTVAEEITVEKLECISMADNMRRNSYHRYPQPIPKLIQLRGALNRKINRGSGGK